MFHRLSRLSLVWLALCLLLTGCASMEWMPRYMEAKLKIDNRYRSQMTSLQFKRMRGEISSSYYQRRSRAIEAQWDRELTVAKARAQGRTSTAKKSTSGGTRTKSGGSRTSDDDSTAPPSRNEGAGDDRVHVPLDTGGELQGGRSSSGGRLD